MGSGASTDDSSNSQPNVRPSQTPSNTPRGAATDRSSRKNRGFKEVEIKHQNGSVTNRETVRQRTPRREVDRHVGASGTSSRGQGASGSTGRTQGQSQQKGSDDVIFETFYHRSGKEIQCMYLNHMRFYLDDWGSKEWQPFPKRWYNEGLLVTNSVVKDSENEQRRRQDQSGASGSNQQRRPRQTNTGGGGITSTGEIVMIFLALLRACNYDPDECITTYLNLDNDPWLKTARTSKEAKAAEQKDDTIETLQQQLKEMEESLKQERAAKQEAEKIVKEQTEKLSELEAENHQVNAQLMALQNARPKTARPKTPQVVTQVVKEPTINPDDLDMLSNSAKELRKCQAQLKMQCQRNFDSIKDMMAKAVNGMRQIKSTSSGSMEEMEEVRALYRKEAMQRKLLYNQLQELRGNIRVFCRVRKDDRGQCCMKFLSDSDLMVMDQNQGKKMFSFDRVFDMKSTQEMIFDETKSIITSCVDGYNVCLMAYGQTGSGKTFTMMGPENNPGINIRAMKELFEVCKERAETITYSLRVSLIEIYNETIQDLLTSDAKTLELRTAGNKVNIPGLTDVEIKNLDDIKRTMKTGDKNRTTASTKMNSSSSRSHLLLMLAVEGHDKVTGAISKGTLTLCDLAGSERISKTEAEGQRLVEAAAINKSLSALGQVFTGLRTSQLHVPYRNSKLTQILQPSLSGDAKACLFVNCSPDVSNYSETVSTLTFGSNAKQVALGQAKQNIKKGPQ
ncbi:hypothetical protein FSP39_021089 [Pinctada imbricata]|uniref:Kinesin-like protein n=1 Tax=Pinctada imbricata TaxID=66713 RepID=A0AA89C788_PINIB|nr:hypothetical protein FSP39_021089 [Pinctada imbricata]